MEHHKREIESLSREIINQQEVSTPGNIKAAEKVRSEAEPELTNLMRPDAFEHHLNNFLQAERENLNDGDRDEPLCDCSRPTCPVKQATLPPAIQHHDDLLEGIRNYQRSHVGNAKGLSEARDAFIERCAEVKTVLREAIGELKIQQMTDETDDESVEA